jgi:mannitol 2-dehydrogenase
MMPPIPLSRQNLARLPDEILRPTFDPAHVRPGIVHLGLGGFHRAHMARYTHDLMGRASTLDWGIVGVGLLQRDRRMQEALGPQDCLYTLVEREQGEESATVIGSICGVIFAGDSSQAVVEAIADPMTRIVSLTVTENGYCLNPATKQLDLSHPFIIHDLSGTPLPRSAIGILVEAYRRRMMASQPALTALTCDNIQHNGAVLKAAVLTLAEHRDPRLARWIEANARFPSTMVDRITPITTGSDIDYLACRYGVMDHWPVFSETFRQWVIEDDFVQGRPSWEIVGAQLVADVAPYELMKLRLLNASHLAIAGLGRLAGYTYINEISCNLDFRAYMQALMDRETGPTLPVVPGVDIARYKSTLITRFANPNIRDTADRVNADAPINLLIDPIRDRLAADADTNLLALALAAWMKRVGGIDDAGLPVTTVHPLADLLRSRAIEGGPDPRPLLSVTTLFGDLIESPCFVSTLERWLFALYEYGARGSVALARRELGF